MARTRVSRSRRRTPRSKSRSKRRVNRSRRIRNTLFNPRVNLNQFKRRRRSAKRRRRRGTRRLRMIKLFGGAEHEGADHEKDSNTDSNSSEAPEDHKKCSDHTDKEACPTDDCEWDNDNETCKKK